MIGLTILLTALGGVPWKHTLVRHESYEEFQHGSGARCELVGEGGPVRLWPRSYLYRPNAEEQALERRVSAAFAPEGWPEGWARYEMMPLFTLGSFNQLLLSWNIAVPADAGVAIELSVGRKADGEWSPWLVVGEWGKGEWTTPTTEFERVTSFEGGKVDVDYFTSDKTWDIARYRITATSAGKLAPVDVRRVVLVASTKLAEPADAGTPALAGARRRIEVPFRSQKSEKAELAARICSPTSLAMVMAYRGADVPTAQVLERAFDAGHDIYGNWPHNVQAAYTFGVPGYLARFAQWSEVEQHIAAGQPLVISIAAAEGELDGAPYKQTSGHLLVLCGFDDKGDVLVNDPAAVDASKGQTTYRREQLEKVWLARGGTSYVLLPKEK